MKNRLQYPQSRRNEQGILQCLIGRVCLELCDLTLETKKDSLVELQVG